MCNLIVMGSCILQLNVVNVTDWFNPVTYGIARPPGDTVGWFYHRVIWKDMDGDGDHDALTSRTEVDLQSGSYNLLNGLI